MPHQQLVRRDLDQSGLDEPRRGTGLARAVLISIKDGTD
jgi:hypothetical protein